MRNRTLLTVVISTSIFINMWCENICLGDELDELITVTASICTISQANRLTTDILDNTSPDAIEQSITGLKKTLHSTKNILGVLQACLEGFQSNVGERVLPVVSEGELVKSALAKIATSSQTLSKLIKTTEKNIASLGEVTEKEMVLFNSLNDQNLLLCESGKAPELLTNAASSHEENASSDAGLWGKKWFNLGIK